MIHFCSFRTYSLQSVVIEVANGDYGEFVPQLAISANRSICYQTETTAKYDADDHNTPVIKVDTLGCTDVPLLKKGQSMDGKDTIKSPSEWSKFWTLARRCQTYHYRDWVSKKYIMLCNLDDFQQFVFFSL